MRFRSALAAVILLASLPRTASAAPFTLDFTLVWDSTSSAALWGTGAVLSLTVDNGSLSPLNQTYADRDVLFVFVNTTAFGGTYADGFTTLLPLGQPVDFITVTSSGQVYAEPFETGLLLHSAFIEYLGIITPRQQLLMSGFSVNHVTYTDVLAGPGFATANIAGDQLVGAVPDASSTLLLLGFALGTMAVVRRRWQAVSGG